MKKKNINLIEKQVLVGLDEKKLLKGLYLGLQVF